MGSGDSKGGEVQGSMFITLESNTAIPGGILKGSVHISLAEGIVCPSLYLIFKGKESTEFYVRYRGSDDNFTTKHTGKKLLCALKKVLCQWPDTVLPGNFSLPFELKLYDNLHPSFKSLAELGGYAYISYSLRAQLQTSAKKPLKFKLPIYIFASSIILPPEMYPSNLEQKCPGRGKTFFCFKRESAASRVWIEKGIFSSSDVIDIHIEINLSDFLANIERITIEVKKILTLSANKQNNKASTQRFCAYRINTAEKIKKGTDTQLFNFNIPVQSILNNDLCYSMSSDLIKCHYVINVKFFLESYFWKCYRFAEANQPIVILPFHMQVPMIPPPIAPEQWQAKVLPQSYLNADTQNFDNPNTQMIKSKTSSDQEFDKFFS